MTFNYDQSYPMDKTCFQMCETDGTEQVSEVLRTIESLDDENLPSIFNHISDHSQSFEQFPFTLKAETDFKDGPNADKLTCDDSYSVYGKQKFSITPVSQTASDHVDVTENREQDPDGLSNRGASDEKLTQEEIQIRKKAQNRAAQRAFRERKEAKLKELEKKLQCSERHKESLFKEIEELKKQNMEILSKSSQLIQAGGPSLAANAALNPPPAKFTFPTEREFFASVVSDQHAAGPMPLRQTYNDDSGRKLLTVSATWEYLQLLAQEHEFDIDMVMKRLQGKEVCHGHGPAYTKDMIDGIVHEFQV